jgi:hypothetical protein
VLLRRTRDAASTFASATLSVADESMPTCGAEGGDGRSEAASSAAAAVCPLASSVGASGSATIGIASTTGKAGVGSTAIDSMGSSTIAAASISLDMIVDERVGKNILG